VGENAAPDPSAPAETLERERWLREQIDKERELRTELARGLVGALAHEPSLLRFWRWLIDDLRSERREQAALLEDRYEEGLLTRAWAWSRSRGKRRRRGGTPQAPLTPAPAARPEAGPPRPKWWMNKR